MTLVDLTKVQEIGHGSYSRVYSARDPDGITIAVKCNLKHRTISGIFAVAEADFLHRIRGHPHLVNLIDLIYGVPFDQSTPTLEAHQVQDTIHFVLPLATGTLYDCIHRTVYPTGRHYYAFTIHFFVQALLGVEHLHKLGITHRDLKPGNILIGKSPPEQFHHQFPAHMSDLGAQICDFGLARFDSARTVPGPQVGTWLYRAPEIVMGFPGIAVPVDPTVTLPPWVNRPYTNKVDVWSMGCVLFELLARRPMWYSEDDSPYSILNHIIKHLPYRPPSVSYCHPPVLVGDVEMSPIAIDIATLMEPTHSYREQLNLSEAQCADLKTMTNFGLEPFIDVLKGMIQFDPDDRLTISQVLDQPVFVDFTDLIKQVRAQSATLIDQVHSTVSNTIEIVNCVERSFVAEELAAIMQVELYRKRYSKEVIFHGLDFMDRYLVYKESISEAKLRVDSSTQGRFHTLSEIKLYFQVCLYLASKLIGVPVPSFNRFAAAHFTDPIDLGSAMQFELLLCREVLQWTLYRETILEALDHYRHIPSETDLILLISLYLHDSTINGMTTKEAAHYYLQQTYGIK